MNESRTLFTIYTWIFSKLENELKLYGGSPHSHSIGRNLQLKINHNLFKQITQIVNKFAAAYNNNLWLKKMWVHLLRAAAPMENFNRTE